MFICKLNIFCLKRLEKQSDLSQDDQKNLSNEVQKITDLSIKMIDDLLQNKTTEIMSI